MKRFLLIILWMLCLTSAQAAFAGREPLVIFHAGSLSRPLAAVERAFEALHPEIDVRREASGSVLAIRKVTDLGKSADIVISADYTIIPLMMFPEYAEKAWVFARNELVLCYKRSETKARKLTYANWVKVLMDPEVSLAIADPNQDPCGYRSLMAPALWALNNLEVQELRRFYDQDFGLNLLEFGSGLEIALPAVFRPPARRIRIRPKSVELIALLEAGVVDFIVEYRNVAMDHGLAMFRLPPSENLGRVDFASEYQRVKIRLSNGKVITGGPIAYGLTIVKNAPHPRAAQAFKDFLLSDQGLSIIKAFHLTPESPPVVIAP